MNQTKPYVISRTLDAPRDLVWRVHTEPGHLAKWFGPAGTTVLKSDMDLRPGGVHHYGMRTPDMGEMWGKQVYREIKAPEKLVYVQAFSDKDGNLTRHPMAPTWPLQTLATVTFEEAGPGKTKVTISWLPYEAEDEAVKTFDNAHGSMDQGFKGMFDTLEAYLAKIAKN
jgi:uncharacterized protein YndB with AHSA1/START domain